MTLIKIAPWHNVHKHVMWFKYAVQLCTNKAVYLRHWFPAMQELSITDNESATDLPMSLFICMSEPQVFIWDWMQVRRKERRRSRMKRNGWSRRWRSIRMDGSRLISNNLNTCICGSRVGFDVTNLVEKQSIAPAQETSAWHFHLFEHRSISQPPMDIII